MVVDLQYGVCFGKGDSSDWIDWEVSLNDEEEKAYIIAKKLRLPFEDFSILKKVLEEAKEEIADSEIENLMDYDDEYVKECQGRVPVDPDEINTLVAQRDANAMEVFDLYDLSDEELDTWDANELDELPDICDFDPDFEPTNPFEEGYQLFVEFTEHPEEEELGRKEATETLHELLSAANGDYSTVRAYVDRCIELYTCDAEDEEYEDEPELDELAYKIAEELGLSDFKLNDDETDN